MIIVRVVLNIAIAVLAFAIGALATPALAQTWPSRPVHVVVSSGAGGTADVLARIVGDRVSQALGQPFVFENRPGAGGHLGAEQVARAPADGYTLLLSGFPTHAVGPHLFKQLNYDPMRDVPPVAMIAVSPNLLVVNSALPARSLADLVRMAREAPGKLSYSSAAIGTSGHLAAELLKQQANIDVTHIPYKSGPEAVTGVLSGAVDFIFFTVPATLPQVKAGKLRALAITSPERSPLAPDVPTVAESGYPGFEVLTWYAFFAPRGVPGEIVKRLAEEIGRVIDQPDVREKFIKLGAEPRFLGPVELTAFANKDSEKWGALIRARGLKAE